jgi:hypothetical protein
MRGALSRHLRMNALRCFSISSGVFDRLFTFTRVPPFLPRYGRDPRERGAQLRRSIVNLVEQIADFEDH